MIILLVAMVTGTSQINYSRETISIPHGIEANLDLLEKGNGSLGIFVNTPEVTIAPAFGTDTIVSDAPKANRPPFLGNSFTGFKEALAFQESSGDYFVINSYGYLGKYQFCAGTLAILGVSDHEKFLNDPKLQEEVFYANLARNKWILRREIKKYTNKLVQSLTISESGILAAAHLAGPGNVKKYLRSGGEQDVQDAYGTQISDYLRKFAGYDMANIFPMSYQHRSSKAAAESAVQQLRTGGDIPSSD